jgi:hypothetical protein
MRIEFMDEVNFLFSRIFFDLLFSVDRNISIIKAFEIN